MHTCRLYKDQGHVLALYTSCLGYRGKKKNPDILLVHAYTIYIPTRLLQWPSIAEVSEPRNIEPTEIRVRG